MSYSPQSLIPGQIVGVEDPVSSISGTSGLKVYYWNKKRNGLTYDNKVVWKNSGPLVTEAKSLWHHLLDEIKHPFRRIRNAS
jgi:hypothetical protein